MKTKTLKTLALLALLAGGMTSCGGSSGTSLEMWAGGQWTGNDAKNLQTFITSYNKKHDVKINLTLKTEFESQFGSSLQVGRQPDIVVWDRFNTPTYASQEFLYPIDEYLEKDNIDTTIFQEQAYNELTYEGHQYGLPLDLDIWGIYVNNTMLNTYNTANPDNQAVLPTTWEELQDTAVKLTQRGADNAIKVAGYSTQDLYEHYFKFFVSTGGQFTKDGYIDYTTQEAQDTLTYFKGLYNTNVSNSSTNSKEAFKNGKLAMLNQPVYYSAYLKTFAPELDYTFIPQPKYSGTNGKNGGMIGGFGFALPNALEKYQTESWKEKQGLAWEFMKNWLIDDEMQLEWSKVSNTLPALKSIYSSEWIQSTPVLKSAAQYAANYEIRPAIPGFYYIQVNVFDTYMKDYITGSSYTLETITNKLTTATKTIIDQYSQN